MRVRVKRNPKYPDNFVVETRKWYWPIWEYFDAFSKMERAIECAELLMNPEVIDVGKKK